MKKTIYLLTGFFFLNTFFLILIITQKNAKINQLEKEKIALNKRLTRIQSPADCLNQAVLKLEKEKTLAGFKKSALYFTNQTEKIGQDQWQITIFLSGDSQAAADAADLWLDFSKDLQIAEIKPGIAFPLYPRQVVENHHLLITGLAQIKNNQINYGKPKMVFAEIIINRLQKTNRPLSLNLNLNESKIFLNGEAVFDKEKSFSEIVLF